MIDFVYHYVSITVFLIISILVYVHSIRVYGLKTTLITAAILTSFSLIGILTGGYSMASIKLPPYFTAKIGNSEFLISDPIFLFPIYMLIFELSRNSLKKPKGSRLKYRDIAFVYFVFCAYSFCYFLLVDSTAAAVNYYSYINPPEFNIFGFPIWFFMAFSIFGIVGVIYLIIEKNFNK